MGVRVERRIVCDFGDRHTGEIQQWRLSTNGSHKTLDLCANCSRPLQRVWDRGGEARPTPGRMRIYDLREIEAVKQKKTPHP